MKISETRLELESQLFQIGKWAIRSMQYIGYLPLSFNMSPAGFEKKYVSFPVLRAVSIIFGSILVHTNYFIKRRSFTRLNRIFGSTELFAHTLVIATTAVVTTYLRIIGLIFMDKSIQFWKTNVRMLERITMGGIEMQTGGKYNSLFESIRLELKRIVLMLFIPSILHITIIHTYSIVDAIKNKALWWDLRVELSIGSAYWVWMSFFHASHCVWMIFFIKLYTASFRIICLNLDELSLFGALQVWDRSIQVPNPEIYYTEIFTWSGGSASMKKNGRGGRSHENLIYDSKVRNSIKLFQIVETQVKCFNRFFATGMIFDFSNWIVHLLGCSFFACLWISRGRPLFLIPMIVPLFIYNAQMYHLGTEAMLLTKSAQRITKSFQNIQLSSLTSETKIKIQLLVTSISTNPPVISAGHFFTVNRQLITSVICAMTTFLVVLVQFKETDETMMQQPGTNGTFLPPPPN